MTNIIQLLPDAIANQIAAGEVVQRPASAVKELLENAIDAQATQIKLILKQAGKTLIQVVDNGKGMSPMDARMSFERHATSKIRASEDLFAIETMGFRGEALASIAAVSQVEMITKQADDPAGTTIHIAGSKITKQEPCQAVEGTSISIKNLFFNIPARRKFLKSEGTEYKHILDEFHRIVLCYPEIRFSLFHNNNEIYHLPQSNLRQRIVNVFGKAMNEKLVPIEESTDILGIKGYVLKPQFARKTRGDQYFFVNKRFIKSNYMNHAVRYAFENLISADLNPGYFIYIDVDPSKIDVNVHPTKQEIKFEEERLIYNYIKVAVRHALGKHNLTPTLDFEASNFNLTPNQGTGQIEGQTSYTKSELERQNKQREKANIKSWESLYDGLIEIKPEVEQNQLDGDPTETIVHVPSKMNQDMGLPQEDPIQLKTTVPVFQLHQRYILTPVESGFILIDQKAAHERILYEQFLRESKHDKVASQQTLFPVQLELPTSESELFELVLPELNALGWDIESFGTNSYVVHGIPQKMHVESNVVEYLQNIVRLITENRETPDYRKMMAKQMARSLSIKKIQSLDKIEMETIVEQLYSCEAPQLSPFNKNVMVRFELDDIQQLFNIRK